MTAPRVAVVKQLSDMKGSALVDLMAPVTLTYYAQICGWTLA